MAENTLNQGNAPVQDNTIQLKDILSFCIRKWYWFALSVFVCLGIAAFYILKTPKTYTRTAQIMIKNDRQGRSITDMEFSDLGLFSSYTSVIDEVKAFSSKSNMMEVIHRLGLDMTYQKEGRFHPVLLYRSTLPVSVSIDGLTDIESATFTLDIAKDGNVTLGNFIKGEDKFREKVSGAMGDTLSSPIGNIVVTPSIYYNAEEEYPQISIRRSTMYGALAKYSSQLTAALSEKNSNVIVLTYNDISIARAEDILNTLINVYNENWIKDKNQIALSTSMFINDRLEVIEQELATVDSDISEYQSENLVPDVGAASSMYMQQSNEINNQVLALNNELQMTRHLKNYLSSDQGKGNLLPANSGISAASIENQIKEYNAQVLERNNLVSITSEVNPLVVEIDASIAALRQAILTSVDNQILALNNQIASLQRTGAAATSKIAASPTQAKYLLSAGRQQSVKEALYLYLLQKREENELSQAFTAYNTRIIDPPMGSMNPVAPNTKMIMLVALILGLCIPLGIWYLLELFNSTVRGKKDLEGVTMPFLGEIPLHGIEKKNLLSRLKGLPGKILPHKGEEEVHKVVVKKGSRNVVNEAFRVLRTNLEFMTKESSGDVIIISSYNPGSGKSFISMNMAVALAIKDKKVLIIDGDLRHASLSAYVGSPKKGISDYLSGHENNLESLLVKRENYASLHVLPVGTIPPNPTELIADQKFADAIAKFKKEYEYIIIDCPPMDIMADTQIISQYADRTIFVVRAGLFERAMLPQLEETYKSGKYKNMSLVLNGTTAAGEGKYGYKYGYRYGYKDGYHYGQKIEGKDE